MIGYVVRPTSKPPMWKILRRKEGGGDALNSKCWKPAIKWSGNCWKHTGK